MISNNIYGGHTLGIAAGITVLILLLLVGGADAVSITTIWDEESGSSLPFTWNSTNFDGFNVSGTGNEDLTIVQTDLGAADGKTRTIRNWDNSSGAGLVYNTTRYLVEYEISKNEGLSVERALDSAGNKVNKGNYYAKVNLFGEPYIALNGKANKITKLVLEQRSTEQKILTVGETWDMGGGYTLTAQSIDARVSPRQAWVTLSKDGIKLDDKVIAQGDVYTYVQYSLAGETDVPMFVTYIDSIFAGTTTDSVVLKYTWLISRTITEVRTGDRFGLLRVISSSDNKIKFDNDYTISLAPNTTINLAGNIKFKVVDNTTYLKFYPTVEPRLNITASSVSIPAGTPTDVIFTVTSNGSPINGATVSLSGAAVESGITGTNGQANININATYNGTIIAEAGKAGYTNGTTEIQAHSLPIAAMASWNLQEDYVLNLTDIDRRASPRQARLQLSKNGIIVKDSVVTQGNVFEYCPSYNCTFNATVDVIFNGTQGNLVRLINASQYSESTGNPLLINETHLFKSANFTGISWELNDGYELRMMDIDIIAAPRLVWLELLKNDTIVDDAIVSWGQRYYYNYSNLTIFTARVDAIFEGETSSIVKLKEVSQYSEASGEVLINNSTYSFISGVINRTDQPLYEDYTISVLGIDQKATPRMVWLRLYRTDTMVDEKIVMAGEVYRYDNSSKILYSEVSTIFAGNPTSAVQLMNVTQYSETNGSILISNATYIIITKGYLIPVPAPTATPTPAYGTYEVRGTVASETAIAGGFNLSTPPVTWTTQSFAGFYYDLRDNLGKEELSIKSINVSERNISKDGLYYNTSAQPKMLNAVKEGFGGDATAAQEKGLKRTGPGQAFEGGNYHIVGWQAEKYVALNGKINKLTKLVLEHGTATAEKKTLITGETWDFGDGWTLTAQSIDAKSSPRQAWLVLGKDGVKKDDIFVSQGSIYTYVEKNISNETDVPLLVTYVDSVFTGATTDMVQLRYTWAISTSVTTIQSEDAYGIFKDAVIDNTGKTLSLKNTDLSVSLIKGSTLDLTSNLKLRVADNDTLRVMPIIMRTHQGTYELSGTVWNETPINRFGGTGNAAIWNVSNFAGFIYDLDDNTGGESLQILQTDMSAYQRIISKNNLAYRTSAQPKMLNIVKEAFDSNVSAASEAGLERTGQGQAFENGSYYIVGWQGDKYVALNGRVDKLSKLVLEQGKTATDNKTLAVGEIWDMGGGWTLTAQSIDANATPRQVWLVLSKDGIKKDDKIIAQGKVYTYVENSIADEAYVPLFVTYVDAIFAGATTDLVQLRYTWAISSDVITIHSGDMFGVFTVVDLDTANKRLGLKNRDTTVSLDTKWSTTVDLIGNLKFNLANNANILRFMPIAVHIGGSVTPTPTPTPTESPTPTPTESGNGGSSSSGSSGSSGGGGGGGASGENYVNIELKEKYDLHIFKDKVTSYKFTNKSNPILFVNITGNTSAGDVTAAVEVLRDTSSLVKSPPQGIVYRNINIWVGTSGFAVPKNIKEAIIRFRVENSWLNNSKLAGSDIKMVKWDGNGWITLETMEKSRDSTYTYYEAKTDSFSSFAITGLRDVITPTTPAEANITKSTVQAEAIDPAQTEDQTKKAAGFDILLAITTLSAVYILRQRKR